MEAKQYTTKQIMDKWRNKKVPGDKWKWKHNNTKFILCNLKKKQKNLQDAENQSQEGNKWYKPTTGNNKTLKHPNLTLKEL